MAWGLPGFIFLDLACASVTNYPYLWFKNITALLEKRDYNTYNILLFALFVGSLRRFLEWGLGGEFPSLPASNLLMLVGFYWFSFFVFTSILRIILPQPWRVSINVILVGIFLGIFPPILDTLINGTGFEYSYVWGLPSQFNWYLYNPELKIPIGEAAVLWAVIAFTTLYVAYKTRSAGRTAAALFLSYAGVLLIGGVLAGVAQLVSTLFGWPRTHMVAAINLLQPIAALALYLGLQPVLFRGLRRRLPHTFPFVMFVFVGSAFAGGISEVTFIYAALLWIVFLAALVQNDYFDAAEDAVAGRTPYADLDDVRFFTITVGFILAVLAAANTIAFLPLLIITVVSMLYSFPLYRGKRYFPSNLKMEGMWGLSSFSLGVVAAVEQAAFRGPNWWIGVLPMPKDETLLGAFDGRTLLAMLLCFGGYSVVAMLKDYKDVEADQSAGIQTVYTLAARRNWPLKRVHTGVLLASAVSLSAAPLLLYAGGKVHATYAGGGIAAAAGLFFLLNGEPSARQFRHALYLLSAFFLYLALALSFS